MSLSISERMFLQQLQEKWPDVVRRLEALEAVRKPLAAQAARKHESGEALFAEVCVIVAEHNGRERLTGKHVLRKLMREPKPSLRQVQELLRRAKRESGESR